MPLMSNRNTLLANASLYIVMCCIIAAPLALGAVHAFPIVCFALLSLLALFGHTVSKRQRSRPITTSWVGAPIFAGVILTALMLIPLPFALRGFLAPASTETLRTVYELLPAEARGWLLATLSLDPPQTALRLLQLLAASCIFIVISDQARNRKTRQVIFYFIMAGAFVLFTVGIGHLLLEADQIWGLYGIKRTPVFAPMINTNHLSKIFGLFSLMCVAGAFSVRARIGKFTFAVAAILTGLCVFLTLSRGGILVYTISLTAIIAVAVLARSKTTAKMTWAIKGFAAATCVLAIGIGFYVGNDAVTHELGTLERDLNYSSKLDIQKSSIEVIKSHWLHGVGPFAQRVVHFAKTPNLPDAHSVRSGQFEVSAAENVILQTLVDHGPIKGAFLFALCIFVFLALFKLKKLAHRILLIALFFVFTADLFDYAIETGAVLFLVALILALMSASLSNKKLFLLRIDPSKFQFGLGAICIIAFVLSIYSLSTNRSILNHRIAQQPLNERMEYAQLAQAHHPFDSYFAYLAAHYARRQNLTNDAMKWAHLSVMLRPTSAVAHFELAKLHVDQERFHDAIKEFREAWMARASLSTMVLNEGFALSTDYTVRKMLLPSNSAKYYNAFCRALKKINVPEQTQQCLDELAGAKEASMQQRMSSVRFAMDQKDNKGAYDRLKRILNGREPDGEIAVTAAILLSRTKSKLNALEESKQWLNSARNPTPLKWWRFQAARDVKQFDLAWELHRELSNDPATSHQSRRLVEARAMLFNAEGKHGSALKEIEQLPLEAGSDVGLLLWKGRLELKLGLVARAQITYQALLHLAPKRRDIKQFGKNIESVIEGRRKHKLTNFDKIS